MHLTGIVANYNLNGKSKNDFFTIGIGGNVASGKSTFSKKLKQELLQSNPEAVIEIISTDDFLYNNAYLHDNNLFESKGWLSTFDSNKIQCFFNDLLNNDECVLVGKYSQVIGDLVEHTQWINHPTILIIEGSMAMTDLFYQYIDCLVYLEVDIENNYYWYEKRSLKNMIHKKEYCEFSSEDAKKILVNIWENNNLEAFKRYILPFKSRADVILKIDKNHEISHVNFC